MATLTNEDNVLLKEEVSQVQYGTVTMEFKDGNCVAITHSGRVLTEAGKSFREKRIASPGKNVYKNG